MGTPRSPSPSLRSGPNSSILILKNGQPGSLHLPVDSNIGAGQRSAIDRFLKGMGRAFLVVGRRQTGFRLMNNQGSEAGEGRSGVERDTVVLLKTSYGIKELWTKILARAESPT